MLLERLIDDEINVEHVPYQDGCDRVEQKGEEPHCFSDGLLGDRFLSLVLVDSLGDLGPHQ